MNIHKHNPHVITTEALSRFDHSAWLEVIVCLALAAGIGFILACAV